MKKVIAVLAFSMVLGSTTAFAEVQQAVPISQTVASQQMKISVNGILLSGLGYQVSGKEAMIPLRDVAGALGMTVLWNTKKQAAEVTKDQLWTLVKLGEDRYTVNKMSISLGAAPVMSNGKVYVPASFVSKVLHQELSTDKQTIIIGKEASDVQQQVQAHGVITAINSKDAYTSIQINGYGPNGLVLNIGPDTVLKNKDGKVIALSDLKLGQGVDVMHSMATTLSLPPQSAAYDIKVTSEVSSDLIGTSGTIEEVVSLEDQSVKIVVKGNGLTELSPKEVALVISKDTVITDQSGKTVEASKLVKGTEVLSFYSQILTRSLPPMGQALKIVVMPANN
ncbi:copper amine oxidase N-terminal domain-containing protein [Paenibacillus shirakamiensis]|nr:copper amine oxidase N-terminal domain-containing protein [Paenibacillus shirakamiensis]